MKTFVEFRSIKFPAYGAEQEEINPGLWGKRLAEYFVAKLPAHGLTAGGIILEDWGCYVPVEVDGTNLALCCGHQYGDDDEFLVFTDSQQPIVKKLFKKVDMTASLTRLIKAVDQILATDPDIRAINWREP